jgi:hypothetical protein
MQSLDVDKLAAVSGGAAHDPRDTMGPTSLVNGHPYTREALFARRDQLFARANDPRVSNDQWLHEWKRLNDAYQRLPSHW